MAKLENTKTTFRFEGITYIKTKTGYCYKSTGTFDKKGQEMYRRVSEAIFDKAFEDYLQSKQDEADLAEFEARKDAQGKKDIETEQNFNKKTEKKPRKSKDIAYEGNGVTLTAKQVDFIHHVPDTCFYEHGLDSAMWCDVLTDEIGGQFAGKPMTVGAMISTLREKNLIYVGMDRVNGKKAKFFGFTELGKEVAKELGLS